MVRGLLRGAAFLSPLALGGCGAEPAGESGMVVVTSGGSPALLAYFVDVPLDALEHDELDGCVVAVTSGSCQLIDCSGPRALATRASAGVIEVSVDASPIVSATPPPTADAAYGSGSERLDVRLGTTLEVVALGDDVPAFTAEVVQPQRLVLTRSTVISRSRGWSFGWRTTIAAEAVWLSMTPPAGGQRVVCHVPLAAGGIDVDASLVAALGAAGSEVDVSLASVNRVVVAAGAYEVGVYATARAAPAGRIAE